MENLADATAFVKGQVSFHELKAQQLAANPRRTAQHAKFCEQFAALADFLQAQGDHVDKIENELQLRPPKRPAPQVQLSLNLEDIDGLPEELIRELSITDGDKIDFTIQSLMQERKGVMSLDQLLIGLFRKTAEVHKRASLNARIYRMTTKGALFNVPGRKGVYSTMELTQAEAEALDRGGEPA